jgi:hypothetical protein
MKLPTTISCLRSRAAHRWAAVAWLALLAGAAAAQQPPIVPNPANHPGKQMCELATAIELAGQGCNYTSFNTSYTDGWSGWQGRTTPQVAEGCRQACEACCNEHDGVPDIARFLTSAACECALASQTGANPLNCGGPQLVDLMHIYGAIDEEGRRSLRDSLNEAEGLWASKGILRGLLVDHPDNYGRVRRLFRGDGEHPLNDSDWFVLGDDGLYHLMRGRDRAPAYEEWFQQWIAWARPIGASGMEVLMSIFDLCESLHEAADEHIYREGCRRQCDERFQGKKEPRQPSQNLGGGPESREIEYIPVPPYASPGEIWNTRTGGGGFYDERPNIFYTDESHTPCTDPETGEVQETCPPLP